MIETDDTPKLITGSTTSFALVGNDGTGQVVTTAQLAQQLSQQQANLTRVQANIAGTQALITKVTSLGLTMPQA